MMGSDANASQFHFLDAASGWFERTLGYAVVFTYGTPPYCAQVRRDAARVKLKHMDVPRTRSGVTTPTTLIREWKNRRRPESPIP